MAGTRGNVQRLDTVPVGGTVVVSPWRSSWRGGSEKLRRPEVKKLTMSAILVVGLLGPVPAAQAEAAAPQVVVRP